MIYALKNPLCVHYEGKNYIINGYSIYNKKRYADAEIVRGHIRLELYDDRWDLREKLGGFI